MLLNPMGLNSGIWAGNYLQANSGSPAPQAQITVQPHQPGAANGNPLGLIWPLARYVDPVSVKDDPQGTVKASKSGKGSAG
jgi:hypothetical protein